MNSFAAATTADATMLALAAGVFVVAGIVKGIVGLGLPTISMALLTLAMSPAHAAALLIVPSMVTNVWQMRPLGTIGPSLRRLWPMQVGVVAGTLAGAWFLGAPAGAWAAVSLGVALAVYAAWGLVGARWSIPPAVEAWLGPLVGAMTGLVTSATGVFVIPAIPYLQSLRLQRDELVQAMGLSFTVSTIALAAALWINDRYPIAAFGLSCAMLVPAIVGMAMGQRLRSLMSPTAFRACLMLCLLALGVYMIVHELGGR